MRRIMAAAAIAAAAMTATPQPAPAVERSDSAYANVFWYSRKPLSAETYLRTTWYVGIYQGRRTWSDLYKSVEECRRREGRDRCRTIGYRSGVVRSVDSFWVDRHLEEGYLEATYPLQKYDREGHEVGDPVRTHIATELIGIGDLNRYRETWTYQQGCVHVRYTTRGLSRRAEATGVLEGRNLGTTRHAWMSTGGTLEVEHEC